MKATSLWTPSVKTVENSCMAQFMAEINAAHGLNCRSYSDLHAFSKFARQKLSGRRHGVFWVSSASAATGPILNDAENLLRKKPQYNIICSN